MLSPFVQQTQRHESNRMKSRAPGGGHLSSLAGCCFGASALLRISSEWLSPSASRPPHPTLLLRASGTESAVPWAGPQHLDATFGAPPWDSRTPWGVSLLRGSCFLGLSAEPFHLVRRGSWAVAPYKAGMIWFQGGACFHFLLALGRTTPKHSAHFQ